MPYQNAPFLRLCESLSDLFTEVEMANRYWVVTPDGHVVFDGAGMEDASVRDYDLTGDPRLAGTAEVYLDGKKSDLAVSREEEFALAVLRGDREAAAVLADLVHQGWLDDHPPGSVSVGCAS